MVEQSLEIEVGELSRACRAVSVSIPNQTPIEILKNILIKPDADGFKFVGSNNEQTSSIFVKGKGELSATIEANSLTRIASRIKGETARLQLKDNGILKLQSGAFSAEIPTLPASDFPAHVDKPASFVWQANSDLLKAALNIVYPCATRDETRVYMRGVCFDTSTDKCTMVASNGHVVGFCDIKLESPAVKSPILPSEAVRAVLGLCDSVQELSVELDNNSIGIRTGEQSFRTKTLESHFPDWRRVVPRQADLEIEVETQDIIKCFQSVTAVGDCDVIFSFSDGVLHMSGRFTNKLQGHTRMEDRCPANTPPNDLRIGFNSKYIGHAINAWKDHSTIRIVMNSPSDAALFQPLNQDDCGIVVMPIRILEAS